MSRGSRATSTSCRPSRTFSPRRTPWPCFASSASPTSSSSTRRSEAAGTSKTRPGSRQKEKPDETQGIRRVAGRSERRKGNDLVGLGRSVQRPLFVHHPLRKREGDQSRGIDRRGARGVLLDGALGGARQS